MTEKNWTKDAAATLKQSDDERTNQSALRKRESDIITAKGAELWNQLCLTMQSDINDFNVELVENDPRRLRLDISENHLTARRFGPYPLTELLAEMRLDVFHKLEYRHRRRNRESERLKETLEQIANVKIVTIALDNMDTVYFSNDGQRIKVEDVSRLLLVPLMQAR